MEMPSAFLPAFLPSVILHPPWAFPVKVRLSLTGSIKDHPVRSIVFGYLYHTIGIIQRVGWFGVRLSSMIQAVRLALCFIGIEIACADAMNVIPTNRRMQLTTLAGAEMLLVLHSDVPRGHIDSFLVRSCEI